MQDIAREFPFVASLPKAERKAVRSALDVLSEWREASREHGSLMPSSLAAAVLNVSIERVRQYISEGRLKSIDFHGKHYVTEASLNELASSERKNGRPFKIKGIVGKSKAVADYLEVECSK
jgi:hypothetical protein